MPINILFFPKFRLRNSIKYINYFNISQTGYNMSKPFLGLGDLMCFSLSTNFHG